MRRPAGNPFFMHALLDELVRDGIAPRAVTAERVLTMGPRTVASTIVARLVMLSPASAPLARAVAVLGRNTPLEQAAGLAGLGVAEAQRAADELVRVSVLAHGDGLRFAHPIIRNAVYQNIRRDERDRLHWRAAEVLFREGAPPERIAAHLLASRPAGNAGTCETLRQAAREALAVGAADSAVTYLRRALAEPPAAQEHGALLVELGSAELLTDGAASIAHLHEALPLAAQPAARAAVSIMLARSLLVAGRVGEAAATAAGMLAKLGEGEQDDLQRQLQAIILVAAALFDPSLGRLRERVVAQLRAVDGEESLGARMVQAVLAFEDARTLTAPARQLAARVERVLADGLLLNDDGLMGMVPAVMTLNQSDSGLALTWLDRVLDRVLDRARRLGDVYGLATGHVFRCRARLVRGELEDAILDGRAGVDAVQQWGLTVGRPYGAGYLAAAQMEAGDLDGAERTLAAAAAATAEIPQDGRWLPYLDSRARLLLLRGEFRACLEATLDCARRFDAFGGLNPAFVPWRSRAARCLAGLSEQRERAAALAAEEVELARTWGEPRALGAALHAQALVQGRQDGESSLREALQILEGSPARLEHARVLVALGTTLRRQGRRSEARVPLRSGLELARSCGATPLAERAYQELRATGASPRKLIRTGAETLTACERRVAKLAASGMTNKQIAQELFVTAKTVESHLAQSYRKLGISSRTELSSALSQDHTEASTSRHGSPR
jgi:DNA-binding CsgD family transcriptional regulator